MLYCRFFLRPLHLELPQSLTIMQFTAQQIAQYIGGRVEGDPTAAVSTFAKIEEATPGSLTFLANPKYTHYIYDTQASIVLVADNFESENPIAATLIRVADPYSSLAKLLELASTAMRPALQGKEEPCHVADDAVVPESCYVGAFAYIGRGVKLGNNVKIYPQAYIGDGVEIGDDTTVYAGVKIYHNCRIGRRCVLHSGAVIGADGFGFAPDANGVYHKIEQIGIVEIEDDVEIGANTTVDRSTMGRTLISRGVKLDNLIQVAHNVEIGHDTVMASQVGIAGSTKIGSNCMFGGQVGISGHITIGDGTQIGAQSGLPKSVAAGSRMMGSPALPMGEFARLCAYQKNLGELFARVRDLEKKLTEK